MSPRLAQRSITWAGFPRVSGDEPGGSASMARAIVFSPRERG